MQGVSMRCAGFWRRSPRGSSQKRRLRNSSQNVIIPSLLRTMNARITQLRRVSLSNAKRLPGSIKEIRAVLKAIRNRDPEAAFQASMRHVVGAQKAAIAKLKD